MKIAVFGANGGTGRLVVEQLLAAGHQVTAIVRNRRRLEIDDPALRVVVVSALTDPEQLAAAISGQDAVISGVGPRSTKDGPVASTVTAAIVAAMHSSRVRRLVVISAAPVGEVPAGESLLMRLVFRPVFRTLLRPVFLDLANMESELARSGLDWTAVRPPRLTDGPLTRRYRQRIGGSVPRGFVVSRADTAEVMCKALTDPATFGQPVGVAN
jgi:putative NADH-flavin reductase